MSAIDIWYVPYVLPYVVTLHLTGLAAENQPHNIETLKINWSDRGGVRRREILNAAGGCMLLIERLRSGHARTEM